MMFVEPKQTIVYLPEQIDIGDGDILYYTSKSIHAALDAAGVKWVQETPEEHKIRMMSLQIEELKDVCTKLQRDLKEALTENGSLAGLLADAQKQIDELDDQNEALKMTARTAQERLDAVLGEYKQ